MIHRRTTSHAKPDDGRRAGHARSDGAAGRRHTVQASATARGAASVGRGIGREFTGRSSAGAPHGAVAGGLKSATGELK
jgi:hypothetical protein